MKRALFVCIGNAGRSQMAQAFYERLGGEARSAGSRPESQLHESVVNAMQDAGIDISARRPKGYTDAELPTAETIATKLNRLGYYPKKVAKSQPQKNGPKPMRSLPR